MTTHKDDAIVIENLNKVYKLYSSTSDQIRDILKLKTKQPVQEHIALKDVNLRIAQGQRIALIGRNGAGKSTLLKMLTGNFKPTSGHIKINGKVQALMSTGVGFHSEFTGYKNIKASLTYNGLSPSEIEDAIEDIVDFVELGDYIYQPVKTYSLGMQSRLSFATATAIKPEILIVDEVLGAGDAYFSAKSADRMKKLTNSGCTLLLVSHATSQVLQFCEDAVWLENGGIVKQGKALDVVKSYESYTRKLEIEHFNHASAKSEPSVIQSKWLREKLLKEVVGEEASLNNAEHSSTGGVSSWGRTAHGLKIANVNVLNEEKKPTGVLSFGKRACYEIEIVAEEAGEYDCHFVIVIFSEAGTMITRHRSECFKIKLEKAEKTKKTLVYDKMLLGTGKYIFTAAIFKSFDAGTSGKPAYYDLLSRSFEFTVAGGETGDASIFKHPCLWD